MLPEVAPPVEIILAQVHIAVPEVAREGSTAERSASWAPSSDAHSGRSDMSEGTVELEFVRSGPVPSLALCNLPPIRARSSSQGEASGSSSRARDSGSSPRPSPIEIRLEGLWQFFPKSTSGRTDLRIAREMVCKMQLPQDEDAMNPIVHPRPVG